MILGAAISSESNIIISQIPSGFQPYDNDLFSYRVVPLQNFMVIVQDLSLQFCAKHSNIGLSYNTVRFLRICSYIRCPDVISDRQRAQKGSISMNMKNSLFGGKAGKIITIVVILFVAAILMFDVSYQVREQEQAVWMCAFTDV